MGRGYNRRVEIEELVKLEEKRQTETLTLIPSENYASKKVREAMGSVFANKYAEGYPGKRYYQGNEFVDQLERLVQEKAKALFGVPFVNVQPLSGAPANLAILKALMNKEDIQLSQHLSTGGHLSMGQEASITSEYRRPQYYHLTGSGEVDWEELEALALKFHPKVIWSGGTGYTKIFDWKKYADIADKTGAYFVADISHIGGLVAGGAHPSPVPYVDVIMTTTHKTLRGPRGAMIMVTEKGRNKDQELENKINKAVFPGIQGGPHMENVAALGMALDEAADPEFKVYANQIVLNARKLAEGLKIMNYELIGGGTQNHMIWINLENKGIDGWTAAWGLEGAGLVANRQTIPGEKRSAYYPSGLRLGTPAVTTRGMKEKEMERIAKWLNGAIERCREMTAGDFKNIGNPDRETDQAARKRFKEAVKTDEVLTRIRGEVKMWSEKFPVP